MTLDQVELKVDVSKLIQGAKLTDRELPTMDKLARAFHILTTGTWFKHSGWCMG
jgi:hypothetical protein